MAVDRLPRFAALLTVSEVGLGSLIHGVHLPFGGHLLSLNQGLLLLWAARGCESRRRGMSMACGVSSVAAALKAFSPIGKKLTPMLAISVQGFLFSGGFALFGMNALGAAFGMMLLSAWGFVQPLLIAYLLFGRPLFEAIQKLWNELAFQLGFDPLYGVWILIGAVLLKALFAAGLGAFAWGRADLEGRYLSRIEGLSKRAQKKSGGARRSKGAHGSVALAAASDLLAPWFLIAFAMSVGVFVLSQDGGRVQIGTYVLRTLAAGWSVFYVVRAFPEKWVKAIVRRFPMAEVAVSQLLDLRRREES